MIQAEFRPLDLADWPGTPTYGRKSAPFRTTWPRTLDLLEAELRHLGATNIVIRAAFESRDIRNDGWPRADARKPSFPGVIISFESKVGPLQYATDVYGDANWRDLPGWQANVRAVALSLEALRAVDRHGVTGRGEQYVGFGALPAASMALEARMTEFEACQVLGLDHGTFDRDQVTSAFRSKARDASEDAAALHQVMKARDVLLEYLR